MVIKLKPLSQIDSTQWKEFESRQWEPDDRIPMLRISVETSALNGVQLFIKFDQPVNAEIIKNDDKQIITIQLAKAIQAEDREPPSIQNTLTRLKSEPSTTRAAKPELEILEGLPSEVMLRRIMEEAIANKQQAKASNAAIEDTALSTANEQNIEQKDTTEPAATYQSSPPMEAARKAVVAQNYSAAIELYNKILQDPDNPDVKNALEFMGLAREKSGQLAHAKSIYNQFLEKYPEGEASARVRQRLAGIITANQKPKEKLKVAKRSRYESSWNVFGGISQYYQRYTNITDAEGNIVTQSSLSSDFYVTARRRGERFKFSNRIAAGYLRDFTDDQDHITRISSLYFDLADSENNYFTRIGRQTRNTGGVLGRFDGIYANYQFNQTYRGNLVVGNPVDSTKDTFSNDRQFYGLSLDISAVAQDWDFSIFAIDQTNHKLSDRRAIGGEVRYFQPGKTLFGLVDYDIFYNELNNFLLLGSKTLENKLIINANIDFRKSPVLTTRNAMQGQTVEDLGELQTLFTADEIYDLAKARTADSKTFSLGLTYPLNKQLHISADISASEFSATPAAGGVLAIDGSKDNFVSLQLIASDYFKQGDINILGLRFSDSTTSNTLSLSFNGRYPVNNQLRINPRFRLDFREHNNDGRQTITLKPSVRSEYRLRKRFKLEGDIGGEWSSTDTSLSEDTRGYFINLGFRYDF